MLRTSQNGFSLSGNQFHNITVQLEAGVRVLHGQIFFINNEIRICHSSCALLDGGRLEDTLSQVAKFLEKYKGEIVTLMWINPDGNTPLTMLDRVYRRVGLAGISYIAPHEEMLVSDWPTIEEMALAERRVVTFLDTLADRKQIPYIHPLWSFIRETPSTVTDKDEFTCGTGRDQSPPGEKLALLNHYLYEDKTRHGQRFPDVSKVGQVNSASGSSGALLNHLDLCHTEWDRKPNFAMVDFFDRGDVFLAQDVVNGIKSHPLKPGGSLELSKDTSLPSEEQGGQGGSKFITLTELEKERQREKEKEKFEDEVEDGRRKAGISGEDKGEGSKLPVFTFTRTVPEQVRETEGVINAGAPDPNHASGRVGAVGGWKMVVAVVGILGGWGMVW